MNLTHTKISLDRPIGSYAEIQLLYSRLIRGSKTQLSKLKNCTKNYLNVGCGSNLNEKFINLDYQWKPKLDLCWDATKEIPLSDNSMKGIYTEHCLEHITFSSCQEVINEFYRVLQPDGVVRIIVPDAELFINLYIKRKRGEAVSFPYVTEQDIKNGYTPIMSINRMFRNHGHLFAYDHDTLSMILSKAGFTNIKKESFMQGRDSELLIDSEARKIVSLYIEASKPA